MIVECNRCDGKVEVEVLGSYEEPDEETGLEYLYSLARCKHCGSALLVEQEDFGDESNSGQWSYPKRVWPDPDSYLDLDIPSEARSSLQEARKCYKVAAFSACAVMCGRAIEVICVKRAGQKTLAKGLKTLKEKGIIDGRLFEWGDSLRQERNLGAHASGVNTTRDDARDILDFATAICEYVFVLAKKYDAYKSRKEKKRKV